MTSSSVIRWQCRIVMRFSDAAMTDRLAKCHGAPARGSASRRLVEDLPPDQHAADLARAGADLVELGVAQEAPGRIVVDVAVAAEALDGVESDRGRALGGVEDRAGGVLAR